MATSVDILAQSNDFRAFELKPVILSPRQWAGLALSKGVAPLNWTSAQVAHTDASAIPDKKRGVYTFLVQPAIAQHPACSYLLYVGKAAGNEGFRARYRAYLAEQGKTNSTRPLINRMIRTWFDNLWFCYAEVPDSLIDHTEEELQRAYLPPMNNQFPADVTAAIRAF